MGHIAVVQTTIDGAASGRPREIESFTNLRLVHPVSHALVDRLVGTAATPNQVSMASVVVAAAGAYCYWALAWPLNALAGLVFLFAWHVLDGADGDLARRTGRASPMGELIDGVCDHASQVLVYVALALVLQRALGPGAWLIAVAAGASHFVQSNAYETGRKTYRRWVYGADWMRQTAASASAGGPVSHALSGLYMALSSLADPGEARVAAAMEPLLAEGPETARAARSAYREVYAPLVKASGVLDGNTRTMAVFASMLVGSPLWFFLFEIFILNAALAVLSFTRRRRDTQLLTALKAEVRLRGEALGR